MDVRCQSLAQVRANIDRIDRQLVTLLAERGRFVSQAAGFKRDTEEVRDGQRVEQVITGARWPGSWAPTRMSARRYIGR
jgi:isochorismate pyruvate lyase